MIVTSKNTHAQISMQRVVAKMEGITLNNLPFNGDYDHKVGIASGDLPSYQMDHLPIEGQIILAEHQLNKVRSLISCWRRKNTADGLNMGVGINDKERYRIFKNAPDYLSTQMNSALKPLAEIDPTIPAKWQRLSHEYESSIQQIELAYPSKSGCYKNRMARLTPILIKYLDAADRCTFAIKGYYEP